jgi:haloacetate dehalogenase
MTVSDMPTIPETSHSTGPIRRRVSVGDVSLSYLEWPGQGEPLLLLHGLADHALVWQGLAESLQGKFRIIAPDMRGHGESDKPTTGYTFADTIADLEGLMRAVGWESAHVVGHSWTGKLAPIWARTNPERLRSLVLVDPIFIVKMPAFMRLTFPILYRKLDCFKGMGPFPSLDAAIERARELRPYRGWSPLQERVFRESLVQSPDGKWRSKFTIPARNGIFEEVLSVDGLTAPVATKTLLILPVEGVNRMDWQVAPFRKFCRNLVIRRIPGNHWPFLSAPTEFNAVVSDFLADQS